MNLAVDDELVQFEINKFSQAVTGLDISLPKQILFLREYYSIFKKNASSGHTTHVLRAMIIDWMSGSKNWKKFRSRSDKNVQKALNSILK